MKEIIEGWKKKPPAPATYVPESVYEATTQRADWPQIEARIRKIYGQGWRLVGLPKNFKELCQSVGGGVYVLDPPEFFDATLCGVKFGIDGGVFFDIVFDAEGEGHEYMIESRDFPISEFGKTVFLTEAEAEAALKAMGERKEGVR